MSTWIEQLQKIEQLRAARKSSDASSYASGIRLKKTSRKLDKIQNQETGLPSNEEEINFIRKKIAELEERIRNLNVQLSERSSILTQIEDKNNLIDFLQKKIKATKSSLQEISARILEEKNKQKPDRASIDEWTQLITQLQALEIQLEEDLAKAEDEKSHLLNEAEAERERRRSIEAERARLSGEKKNEEEKLGATFDSHIPDPQEWEDKKRNEEREYKNNRDNLNEVRGQLHSAIGSLYADPHPRTAIKNLDDSIPFLLLPVRIETRFVTEGRQPELLLRIYPDDIAVHTHEGILTDKEVTEGAKYWKAIFKAEKDGTVEKEDQKKSDWSYLATIFGSQRSAWIAKETQPKNWAQLEDLNQENELDFPVHDLTKTSDWSRAPRTEVLPDKFVAIFYEGDTIVRQEVGKIIPDELFVGPDPIDAEAAFVTKDNKLVYGAAYDWMSDFDKAVELGMGFRIPLSAAQANNGFTKIIVLGVSLSANETVSQATIESLINNHHFSPKGFSLVRQGSPTNNTDLEESGYTKNDSFNEISYYTETGKPNFTFPDDCDGRNLADALGIEYDPLQYVLNSNAQDHKEAVAMNTALYASTLGHYFGSMMHPVLDESFQRMLRDFTVNHVTGRGWLPAIRIGNQPYGVLLTSDTSKWEWPDQGRLLVGNPFYKTIWKVLEDYHLLWKSLLNELMHVGKPGIQPSEVLMNILGLQPSSVSFYQRIAYSTDDLWNRDDFEYGGRYYNDMQKGFDSKNNLLNFLNKYGYNATDNKGKLQIPQQLRLIFQHYHTLLDAANLVDNVPLSEKEIIQFYDSDLKKNYLHWLAEAKSVDALEAQDFGTGKTQPSALLYLQLRRSLLLQLKKSTVRWYGTNNIDLNDSLKPKNFHNIRPGGTVSSYELMKAKIEVAAPGHYYKSKPIGDFLLTAGINEDAAEFLTEMKSALNFLAKLPTARLERCFAEHLDTCTYRLDAWQSAIFKTRLLKQRGLNNIEEENQRKKGIYLGAFGWVENLHPSGKRMVVSSETVPDKLQPIDGKPLHEYSNNGGFVHAPSINHASAAALLRAGYMSHATATKPDTLAVNLSSERVRRALFILQGIRNGQSLEALLGYQFERGLHDSGSNDSSLAKLNLYIYDYRDAYLMNTHLVKQKGDSSAEEALPANNVVNGLLLAENNLDFPFGAKGAVLSASINEKNVIISEKNKLSETLDAVKDLLMSESVFQLVQGNFDRSGAVVNALKDANIPPELDVINTPGSTHFNYTNRVMIQFEVLDPGDSSNNPWDPIGMTARARMEPGINKWLGSILGSANDLVCRVAHKNKDDVELGFEEVTVDKLKLQPIDLIYIAGNELNTGSSPERNTAASELESRIAFYYRRLKAIGDDIQVSIEFMKPENPAGKKTIGSILPLLRMLKSIITDCRNLHAEDFDPPSKTSLADKSNPKAYEVASLQSKIQQEGILFKTQLDALDAIAISAVVEDRDGVVTNCTTLKETFDALEAAKKDFSEINFTFGNIEADLLQQTLVRISNYGLPDTFPQVSSALTDKIKITLLEQGRNVSRRMTAAHSQKNDLLAAAGSATIIDQKVEKLQAAGKKLMGDVFNILPAFTYNNEVDIQQSRADNVQLLKHATTVLKMRFPEDEWLQNIAHVRPLLSKWEYVRTLHELLNDSLLKIAAIQLPYRAFDSWVAVEFPEKDSIKPEEPFNISHDTLSIVIHGDAAFTPGSKRIGLLVDDWTEKVPAKENMTGISFNYDQPNAVPPQSLLLAVTPKEKGNWEWDDLVGILNDTMLRLKLRAIEPRLLDKVNKPELGVLLPAVMADFSQYDLDIALDYRLNLEFFVNTTPILKVGSLIN